MKIYLFRHGQTVYNRDKIFTGWKDSKLTKLGVNHARIIARKLKSKSFEIAFQTKLSRSKDTLKEVLNYHPECKKIITDNRMIERNYGNLNGKSHLSIIKKYGKEQYEKWHRGFYDKPPKGESFDDVEKRVKSFIGDLIKIIKKEKVNVAISAHGNSIRLFRKIIEKASIKQTVDWVIPYTNFFEYEIKE
jgi:2,3-bisphosphoglycerate-dependent phosphoglycerate mutase